MKATVGFHNHVASSLAESVSSLTSTSASDRNSGRSGSTEGSPMARAISRYRREPLWGKLPPSKYLESKGCSG
jgi:hypothetical protein